jgi:hypothetical protein
MGPNLLISPPGGFTHLHLDGSGTADSGHLCLSGWNEIILFDRMSTDDMETITKRIGPEENYTTEKRPHDQVSPMTSFADHTTLFFTMILILTQKCTENIINMANNA